ncbi:MAG: ABC transporter ATP-binding protein [Chloroflexi bacterium]|nr:MAG: ABC transporter ATP-binding protein [Chloroflexota bacterium]
MSAGDLWRYRWPLALAACLTVVETLMDLAKPWPLLLAIDHAIGGQPLAEPWAGWLGIVPDGRAGLAAVAALAMVALAIARALVAYLAMYLSDASAERIGADARSLLHARLLDLSLRFHHRQRTGDLAARLTTDVGRVQDALVDWFTTVVPEVPCSRRWRSWSSCAGAGCARPSWTTATAREGWPPASPSPCATSA